MKINKEICRIAFPAIVSNITVPILGLADTTIAGHLGSDIYIGAIAVGSMMINVVLWCFGFLRSGTSGMTAQAFGASDTYKQRELFSRSLLLALFIGLLMIISQYLLERLLLQIIGADNTVNALASTYFRIIIWGAPAMLGTMAVSGWFLGMQSSLFPMIIAIVTNIVNIVTSLLAVYGFGKGFIGIAVGTCVANWIGLLLALVLVYHFCGGKIPWASLKVTMRIKGAGKFFKVNTDIFLRSMCIMLVSLGMTAYGAQNSSLTLAVNAVMMQFFLFFSYFMDGFAFSAEALTGKCVGLQSNSMLSVTKHALGLWGVVMSIIFTLIYWLLWSKIGSFITTNEEVLNSLERYHIWLVIMPAITVAAFIYDGIYIGLTATRLMFIATAIGTIVFFLFNASVSFLFINIDANDLLWLSFLVYLLIRGVSLALLCPKATRIAMS